MNSKKRGIKKLKTLKYGIKIHLNQKVTNYA